MPVMGRHSVILRPDSVRRVTPPTTITAKTRVEENISQLPTDRDGRTSGFVEKGRMCARRRIEVENGLVDRCFGIERGRYAGWKRTVVHAVLNAGCKRMHAVLNAPKSISKYSNQCWRHSPILCVPPDAMLPACLHSRVTRRRPLHQRQSRQEKMPSCRS